MQSKLVPKKSLNDLQMANKYIFVQDFEKAEAILRELTTANLHDYEIFFRRVEVAIKRNALEPLIDEFKDLLAQKPHIRSIEFGYLLARVRSFPHKAESSEKRVEKKERFQFAAPRVERFTWLTSKKIKISRSALLPDDVSIVPVPLSSSDHMQEEEMQRALALHTDEPDNYAAWFLAGCVYESMGVFDKAVEKWKRAFELNSFSISAISALVELQHIRYPHLSAMDYSSQFEMIDKYIMHGHFETHTELYKEFIQKGEYRNAIGALRTLADWLQQKHGNVPVEVEALCLLGAMKAYKLDGNESAAEACRDEVENVVISYQKSLLRENFAQLMFIAQMCEEYNLKSVAKMCYFSILNTTDMPVDAVVEAASRCVSQFPSEALYECLKLAIRRHKGNLELCFFQNVCLLKMNRINVTDYVERKSKVRQLLEQYENNAALLELLALIKIFDADPELHYYLGEIYLRLEKHDLALVHFEKMYNMESYNPEGVLRYVFLLLKEKRYAVVKQVCQENFSHLAFTQAQENELRWCLSAVLFVEENYEQAQQEILKSLEHDPWNSSYMVLFLRVEMNLDGEGVLRKQEPLIRSFEDLILKKNPFLKVKQKDILEELQLFTEECIAMGYGAFAWTLAKCAFVLSGKISFKSADVLARAGAAYHAHVAVRQLLLLLRNQSSTFVAVQFSDIAANIAFIYGLSGEWSLVAEWLGIAQSGMMSDEILKVRLFELEALSLSMQGQEFKRAQVLLEAVIGFYAEESKVPSDTFVLYGYVLLAQGHISLGLSKIQRHLDDVPSVQSLYFFIKGLERANKLDTIPKDVVDQVYQVYPMNSLEQKLIEEIFYTVGTKIHGSPLGLAC